MSTSHPIIAVTGSSGAGTTSVSRIFQQIFRRERIEDDNLVPAVREADHDIVAAHTAPGVAEIAS